MSTLDTWVGFTGDTAPAGPRRPSTEWPVQRFLWSDYDPPREEVSYQAVPLIGDKDALVEDAAHATDWRGKYAVSGAQPPEVLLQLLQRAYADRSQLTPVAATADSSSEASCDGDSCAAG